MSERMTPDWVVKLFVGALITGALALGATAAENTEKNSAKILTHDVSIGYIVKSQDEIKASILRIENKLDRERR